MVLHSFRLVALGGAAALLAACGGSGEVP